MVTPKQITTLAHHRLVPPWVMKLALEVAAFEREACAKLCLKTGIKHPQQTGQEACAAAIRARSEK